MTTKINPHFFYSSMDKNDDQLFSDQEIQRYDADTIKHRYGDNWRSYASNVREIKQADGSIVREYIIEDPTLLKEIKPSIDSTSSTTGSDDEQQSLKNKFAQIKAKFEQKSFTNVMASPSSSSVASSNTTTTTRRNSNKQIDDFNTRNRQESNDSLSNNRTKIDIPIAPSTQSSTSNSQQSQSISNSSFRRLNSGDEADAEVQRIQQQGNEFRQHYGTLPPINQNNQQSNVEYEVVDEDGNPMAIEGIHDLIKMSGVTAREVPQADGTLIREYVIDDPKVLSKFHSQQQQSSMTSQQQSSHEHIPAPPPPPRVPLKQSILFRQEPLNNDNNPPINIQQIRTIEPQRRYEFMTASGKRIEFMITNLGSDDSDIHELANAINTRLLPSSSNITQQQQQAFTLPKQWNPAVDLTHRETPSRQRNGSENQQIPNNYNMGFQQAPPPLPPMQTDTGRSSAYGAINQGPYQQQFAPVFAEPIIDWSAVRQQDPEGQIDPQYIRQFITQKHQNGSFQTSAQFLPEQQQQQQQMTSSRNSPPRNNPPVFYQQAMSYPYQGQQQQQQQHGVRIPPPNNNDLNFHQQQIANGHTRI